MEMKRQKKILRVGTATSSTCAAKIVVIVITNFELDVPSPGLLYFPKLRDHFPFIAQSFAKLRRRLSLAARMKGETTQRRCEHQAALLRRRVQRGVCPFLGRGRVGGQGRGRGCRVPRRSRTRRYAGSWSYCFGALIYGVNY